MTELQPHQQRVVDEKIELDGKLIKLSSFFGSAIFVALTKEEQARLYRQNTYMRLYSDVLSERIAAF